MTETTPGPASTPAQDAPDAVAMKTEWTYLVGPGAYFPKVRLLEESPTRWTFMPEGNHDAVAWLLILSGSILVACIGWILYSAGFPPGLFYRSLPGLFLLGLIIGRGVIRFRANRTVVAFDLDSKTCRLGYRRGAGLIEESGQQGLLAGIGDIRVVQLLHVVDSPCCRKCYELNLVLDDDSRVFVVGAWLAEPLHRDAVRLAGFLGRPLVKVPTQAGPVRFDFLPRRPRPVRRGRSHEAPKVL
ncbi:MAG: hypothetical protein CVU59_08365 [Deltaproteobacteria bacterium HGW-Deltaproteobacteria-17]|nr:MAG: hypothetical protein CVU59_08365 [Deltaproteobacteria bacterium HGW-Deltaproteobacteria-17]